jgi:hypothetical protein
LADDDDYSLMPLPERQHSEQDKVLARLGREEREKQEFAREEAFPLGNTTCKRCSTTNLPTHRRCFTCSAYNVHNELDSNAEKKDIMVEDILNTLRPLIGQNVTATLDENKHLRGVRAKRMPFTESWAREFAVRRLSRWAKRMSSAGWTVDPDTVTVAYWWKYHDGAELEIQAGGYNRRQFEIFMPQLQDWIENQRAGGASSKHAPVDRQTTIRTFSCSPSTTSPTSACQEESPKKSNDGSHDDKLSMLSQKQKIDAYSTRSMTRSSRGLDVRRERSKSLSERQLLLWVVPLAERAVLPTSPRIDDV